MTIELHSIYSVHDTLFTEKYLNLFHTINNNNKNDNIEKDNISYDRTEIFYLNQRVQSK
jgi:hypothetical protein